MTSAHNTTPLVQPVTVFPHSKHSKPCTVCKAVKPLSDYNVNNAAPDGRQCKCKKCKAAYRRENREKIAGQKRAYRAANREKVAERSRAYNNANREKIAERSRRWRDDNVEALAAKRAERKAQKPLYDVWSGMKRRCHDASSISYINYGARGITVCQRWLDSLDAFIADIGPRPTPEHQLDRIDNDAGYSPDNCRWLTRSQNCHNRRNRKTNTGTYGVHLRRDGRYVAQMQVNGVLHQKYFKQRWDAICYRKSLEDKFNNTGTL